MSRDGMDTETMLALLASLLPSPPDLLDESVLLDALVAANGDIEKAASSLRDSHYPMGTRKRKRDAGLDTWLSSASKRAQSPQTTLPPSKDVSPTRPTQVVSRPQSSVSKDIPPLMSILRPPPSLGTAAPRLAPLTLSTPGLVEEHTTCTLHPSVLPPELACRLYYAMMRESQEWSRNQWFLFGRQVESPHKTSFYVRKEDGVSRDDSWNEAARQWYNGRKSSDPPKTFLPEMEEACEIVEKVVNEQMLRRKRHPLEWDGRGTEGEIWRANVAASNCYQGRQESVGFHSDQLTYLGPYPTIASLSLGTSRTFRLREVIPTEEIDKRQARTLNIPLPHNSLIIMHASTQEYFKHSIPPQPVLDMFRPPFPTEPGGSIEPSNSRINITFRFFRPDFRPSSIPNCKCGLPTILKPDMKGRSDKGKENEREIKYWWICYAGAQNDGKGCGFWQVMDVMAEGRGPFVKDRKE